MVGKIADGLAQIKAIAPNRTTGYCFLCYHTLIVLTAASLEKALYEAAQNINFLKPQPLSMCLFHTV